MVIDGFTFAQKNGSDVRHSITLDYTRDDWAFEVVSCEEHWETYNWNWFSSWARRWWEQVFHTVSAEDQLVFVNYTLKNKQTGEERSYLAAGSYTIVYDAFGDTIDGVCALNAFTTYVLERYCYGHCHVITRYS